MKSIVLFLLIPLCGCATKAWVRQQSSAPMQRRVRDVTSFNTPLNVTNLVHDKFFITCPACGMVTCVKGTAFQSFGSGPGAPFTELGYTKKCCCGWSSSYYLKVYAPPGKVQVVQDVPVPAPMPPAEIPGPKGSQ